MILSGKPIADEILQHLKKKIASLSLPPGLAVIIVGDHPSSHAYVQMKRTSSEEVGMYSLLYHLPVTTSEKELVTLIKKLNQDTKVDGVLVQLPLPEQINSKKIMETIDPEKDVDGFHPVNLGKLLSGQADGFVPCTPLGIQILLEKYQIPVEGRNVVILGRSAIVGKPLAALLMQNKAGCNGTVTVVHSKTENLPFHTKHADILVAAMGLPHFVKADMVKKGVVIIDVGINRISDSKAPKGYRIVGDVDFADVEKKASAITPVPKGVGPMTVAMLLQNTYLSYQRRKP